MKANEVCTTTISLSGWSGRLARQYRYTRVKGVVVRELVKWK